MLLPASMASLIPTGHVLALFTMFGLGAFAGFVVGAATYSWAYERVNPRRPKATR